MRTLLFVLMLWGSSQTLYALCSDYADGFLFPYKTSVMKMDQLGAWQETNLTFNDTFSINVMGAVTHDGPQRLLYIEYFNAGDHTCKRSVVRADQVHLFEAPVYVLRCAQNISGFVVRTRTWPHYKTTNGGWAPYTQRRFRSDFEFEIIENKTLNNDLKILIILMNTQSDYQCRFAAVDKDSVVLLENQQ